MGESAGVDDVDGGGVELGVEDASVEVVGWLVAGSDVEVGMEDVEDGGGAYVLVGGAAVELSDEERATDDEADEVGTSVGVLLTPVPDNGT